MRLKMLRYSKDDFHLPQPFRQTQSRKERGPAAAFAGPLFGTAPGDQVGLQQALPLCDLTSTLARQGQRGL